MRPFSVDFFGRSGPNHLLVDLTPAEVCARLEMSLVPEQSESWGEAIFATNRRYSGKIRGNTFELQPLWRNRRFRPSMSGTFEEAEDAGTRITFQIHMDSKVLLPWILPPLLFIPVAAVILLTNDEPLSFFPVWGIAPVFIALVAGMNSLFARHESKKLLEFFEELFREERN